MWLFSVFEEAFLLHSRWINSCHIVSTTLRSCKYDMSCCDVYVLMMISMCLIVGSVVDIVDDGAANCLVCVLVGTRRRRQAARHWQVSPWHLPCVWTISLSTLARTTCCFIGEFVV